MSGAGFQRKISELKPWDFWAHPRSLPLTEEEVAACVEGRMTPELSNRVLQIGQFACHQLIAAVPGKGRPS